jgi:hypothetical protein
MCQVYSGPGSPYFAGMGFLGLAAPADHPLWTSPEQPLPAERGDYVRTLQGVGWVIQATDGIVHIANHASDHIDDPDEGAADPHYASIGYSTHTAPSVGDAWTAAVDGQLALVDEWGRAAHRAGLRGTKTGEGWAASWYRPRFGPVDVPGARVLTLSILNQGVELRAHLVTAPDGWTAREGSFALADDAEELTVDLLPLHGWTGSGSAHFEGGNAFGEHSTVPYLTAQPELGVPTVYVSMHRLGRTAPIPIPVTVEVNGGHLSAEWSDGRRDSFALNELF